VLAIERARTGRLGAVPAQNGKGRGSEPFAPLGVRTAHLEMWFGFGRRRRGVTERARNDAPQPGDDVQKITPTSNVRPFGVRPHEKQRLGKDYGRPRRYLSRVSRASATCFVYRGHREGERIADLAKISEYIAEPDVLVWFDIVQPETHDLELIAEEFELHPLAIEDAVRAHQRAKIESYGNYVFLVVHGATMIAQELTFHEVAIFVGAKFVVSVRADPAFPFDEVLHRWHDLHAGLKTTSVVLLHTLLDTIVDGYAPIEDRIDVLEETFYLARRIADDAMLDISAMKKKLGRFRRAILPMREILSFPLRGDDDFFTRSDIPYFRDVYDHVLLAIDQVEWTRDLLNNVVETQISIASNRQNEVSKQLTIIATIFLPLTFITGFFGQNFGVMVDWIKTQSAFFVLGIGTEVVAVIALLVFFRARGWF
jgi:magnesium transporter